VPRRIIAFFGTGLLSAVLSAIVSAAVPTVPPLEVYGSLPHTEAVEMSADGSMLAIVSTEDDQLVLTVKHADGKVVATVALGDVKLSGLSWAGDDYAIVYTHQTVRFGLDNKSDRELTQGMIIDARSGAQKPLLPASPDYLSSLRGHYGIIRREGHWFGYYGLLPTEPPASLHVATAPQWQHFPDLYRVNFETAAVERVAKGSAHSRSWVLDAAGEIVAEAEYDSDNGDWKVFRPDTPDHPLISGNSPFRFSLAGLARTPDTILITEGGIDPEIKEVHLDTGRAETILPPEKVVTLIRSHTTRLLLGAVTVDDHDNLMLDPTLDSHYRSVTKAFAGYFTRLVSVSDDLNRMVLHVSGKDTPGKWELVEFPSGKATSIAEDYPQIPDAMIGTVQMIDYQAADGLPMQGF
jgi:hypothetical protein